MHMKDYRHRTNRNIISGEPNEISSTSISIRGGRRRRAACRRSADRRERMAE
jgi:hypothetical protein